MASFPSFSGGYIPSTSTMAEITANLVVNYGRNEKDFTLNKYVTITPVKKPIGYYTRLSAGANIRLNPTTGYGYGWAPGQRRPRGEWNQQGNTRVPYSTYRYAYSSSLDLQTIDTTDFALEASYFYMLASQAMTNRAYQTAAVATNSANFPSLHVSTATALAGGFLGAGTRALPYLQRAIQRAAIRISKSTGGMISNPRQLMLITNPNGAAIMSQSEEFTQFIQQNTGAVPSFIKGDEPWNADRYNIPDRFFGATIVVEDSVYNSGEITTDDEITNSNYVWPDNTVLICARGKDLEWPDGAAGNPSTIGIFEYEALSAETRTETYDRLMDTSLSDQFQVQIVSPLTGYLITNAFS